VFFFVKKESAKKTAGVGCVVAFTREEKIFFGKK